MSISSDYAKARATNPSLKFADFQKTVTPETDTTNKPYISTVQQNKIDAGLSSDTDSGVMDVNKLDQPGVGIKNSTYADKKTAPAKGETRTDADGRTQVYTGSYWRTGTTGEVGDLNKVSELSKERGIAEFAKKGITGKEGEVFDPYAALQGRQMEGKEGSVSPYIAEGKATAIREKHMENVGDQPTDPKTQDGYNELSDEEKLQSEADYQAQLADWYRRVGEEAQKELGDVSSQIQNFGQQMQQYQEAIDSLTANISQANPALGSALSEALAEVGQSGGGNLTPEILANIQTLANTNPDPASFKSSVSSMLTTGVSPQALSSAGIVDNGFSFSLSNGVEFPKGANGLPDYSPEGLSYETNAYDIALMELATNNEIAQTALGQEIKQLTDLSKSVNRWAQTYKTEIDNTFDTSMNKIEENRLSAMNEVMYRERKLSLDRDISLDNILEEEAKMEGYMRGQLEAWGADESTAALAVMGNIKLKFLKQYTQTAQGYNIELSRLADLELEARMAFTNRTIEITNEKAINLEKINNNILDNIDKIYTETSNAYENRDLKLMTNNLNYSKALLAIEDAERQYKTEAYRDTRDFSYGLMKEYADQTGFQWYMDKEGNVKQAFDENGYPIPTLAGRAAGVGSETGITIDYGGGSTSGGGTGAQPRTEITNLIENSSEGWIASHGGDLVGSDWTYGIDVPIPYGAPIDSPISGKVVRVDTGHDGDTLGFGNNVVILTPDGYVQFSHLKSTNLTEGQTIGVGDIIGQSGNTGNVKTQQGTGEWHVPDAQERASGYGAHLDITLWDTLTGHTKEEVYPQYAPGFMKGMMASQIIGEGATEPAKPKPSSISINTGSPELDSAIKYAINNGEEKLMDSNMYDPSVKRDALRMISENELPMPATITSLGQEINAPVDLLRIANKMDELGGGDTAYNNKDVQTMVDALVSKFLQSPNSDTLGYSKEDLELVIRRAIRDDLLSN